MPGASPQPANGEDSRALVVVSWNLGFGGGPDGMPTDRHDAASVLGNLAKVASAIRDGGADIVFLEEVDRQSDRSGGIDQFAFLMETTGLGYGCFVTTWDLNWLPFPVWPPSRQLGRIRSGQAILSRFPIRTCSRTELAQPDEYPWWYRRFYLHRSLQTAVVDLGPGTLTAVNVHLEAFSQPNREAQAVVAARHAAGIEGALIVAGDFNALPPDAVLKSGFVDEDIDFTTDRTITLFMEGTGMRECLGGATGHAAALTFPARAPTRRLDHVFFRGFSGAEDAQVDRDTTASDHLAVWTTLVR